MRTYHLELTLLGCLALVTLTAACGESADSSVASDEATLTPSRADGPTATDESAPTETPPPTPTPAPTATPSPVPVPLSEMVTEPAFPNLSFPQLLHLTYPDDGTDRLFAVVKPGRVFVFNNDPEATSAAVFLDIADNVNDSGTEEGLLGMAFDPDHGANGHFYVYYTASSPRRSVLSRFSLSRSDTDMADPTSERIIMQIEQPYDNHNGGQILFGPDGYLYIGLGDGGSEGDPLDHAQNTHTLLGSILRIDVRSGSAAAYRTPSDNLFVGLEGGARAEIWAYGFRNLWRFTFDRETGDLWAADVGAARWEEVDLIKPGLNYGWDALEGSHCYGDGECETEGLEPPVTEYGHDRGCSISGGYVYRGDRLPSLHGAYVYGDYCSGRVWALRYDGAEVTEHLEIVDSDLNITAFGEDPSGELYLLSLDGRIHRLAPR